MPTVYTIGHSTRSEAEFSELLAANGVQQLADIRSYPNSRHSPQFNGAAMSAWLPVPYVHLAALGGRRPKGSVDGSLTDGWDHPAFRNYAAYMQSPEFDAGLTGLIELARERTVACMCSEAVWWRCHRRLVADALTARGFDVLHIMGARTVLHRMTPFAVVTDGEVTYPPAP